jgi:hypothetical protein
MNVRALASRSGRRRRGGSAGGGPSGAVIPDFSGLPSANYQPTDWAFAASLRTQNAGYSWTDPNSGLKIIKLTGPDNFPGNGANHAYANSGSYVSMLWGGTKHTVTYTNSLGAMPGGYPLFDVDRVTGVVDNYRTVSCPDGTNLETGMCWSRRTTTPRHLYYFSGRTLRCIDTNTMTEVTGPFLPRTFTTGELPGGAEIRPTQIGADENDRWFSFIDGVADGRDAKMVIWDSQTNELIVAVATDWGAPAPWTESQGCFILRGGRYVAFAAYNGAEQRLGIFDLQTRKYGRLLTNAELYNGHSDQAFQYYTVDVNDNAIPLAVATPIPIANNGDEGWEKTFPVATRDKLYGAYHITSYGYDPDKAKNWAVTADYLHPPVVWGSWTDDGGGVWRTTITDYANYYVTTKTLLVMEQNAGLTSYEVTYTPVGSRGALTGDNQYFLDTATDILYVRAAGGVNRSARMVSYRVAPGSFFLTLFRVDGGTVQYVCPHFSRVGSPFDYYSTPRPCFSWDGLMAIWSSNLGILTPSASGRKDIFAVVFPSQPLV